MPQILDTVVGGQYGSEAKGHVTAQLVRTAIETAHANEQAGGDPVRVINVRVAGPNAGHTAYDDEGRGFAFRSLPVGAVINPDVQLYIAPGSEVDLPVLYKEIREAEAAGHPVRGRLYMSRQATLIDDRHKAQEQAADLTGRVGSTGKGIGAARAERIMRAAGLVAEAFTPGPDGDQESQPWEWAEPEHLYASDDIMHGQNTHVIIEGTQGYGLSLRASGNYPQTTSSDCRAIDFQAMAGVDPTRCGISSVNWVVVRVFPIRVAGNSGGMKGETSWGDLGLQEERTTVTQKVRRVGAWDQDLVRDAIQANGGHHRVRLMVTMLDQVIPELKDYTADQLVDAEDGTDASRALDAASAWIEEHAAGLGAPVGGFTFGPDKILWTSDAHDRPEVSGSVSLQQQVKRIVEATKAEEEGE